MCEQLRPPFVELMVQLPGRTTKPAFHRIAWSSIVQGREGADVPALLEAVAKREACAQLLAQATASSLGATAAITLEGIPSAEYPPAASSAAGDALAAELHELLLLGLYPVDEAAIKRLSTGLMHVAIALRATPLAVEPV